LISNCQDGAGHIHQQGHAKSKGATASGPRPFKLYVTDELASLTNRVAGYRKNIAAAKKSCYFSPFRKALASQ